MSSEPRVGFNNNITYVSTEIGRIIGLAHETGNQIFTTPVLTDSVPFNICLTKDYLISDIRLRNSNSKAWVVYYKQTGAKHEVTTTNFETTKLYGDSKSNTMIAFCNINNVGEIITYNATNGSIENRLKADNIKINQSCKIDEYNFIFSSNKLLFHVDIQNNTMNQIAVADDDILDIEFDIINNKIILVYSNKAEVLSYPSLTITKTIESDNELNGIELLYTH